MEACAIWEVKNVVKFVNYSFIGKVHTALVVDIN